MLRRLATNEAPEPEVRRKDHPVREAVSTARILTNLRCCDRDGAPRPLEAGIYGLSNHLLDTPWPKVERGKEAVTGVLGQAQWHAASLLDVTVLLTTRTT